MSFSKALNGIAPVYIRLASYVLDLYCSKRAMVLLINYAFHMDVF